MATNTSPAAETADFRPSAQLSRYALEIPTLKSLLIETRFHEESLATGTAILVANDRNSHCALITARHNITGLHQDTGKCLHRYAGIPNNIIIHFHQPNGSELPQWKEIILPLYRDDESPYWIEHPELGRNADLVALNLSWGKDVEKFPYFLKTDLDRIRMVISPSETVSVIGFPFGLAFRERFPLWATGFLAQELSLVTPENPVFMIDCRTRQGQSGSAVIAYRPSGYRRLDGDKIIHELAPQQTWEFLGVYSGRVNAESDLGRVWHVSAVEQLLAAAEDDWQKRYNVPNAIPVS